MCERASPTTANCETITHWYKQSVYDPQDSKIGEIIDVLIDRDGKATALIIGASRPSRLAHR
jgi:hypothetical protein